MALLQEYAYRMNHLDSFTIASAHSVLRSADNGDLSGQQATAPRENLEARPQEQHLDKRLILTNANLHSLRKRN